MTSTVRKRGVTAALALLFGYLTGGLTGMALGGVALWTATHHRREVRIATSILAVVLISLAAGATIFEGSRAEVDLGSDYAAERNFAGRSAQLAGTVTFALVLAAAEQARRPDRELRREQQVASLSAALRSKAGPGSVAPVITAAVGSAVVRSVWGPQPLSTLYAEVADNVDRGIVYGRGLDFAATESAIVAPLAPVLAALAPFGSEPLLAVSGAAVAAGTVALAMRVDGARLGWIVAVLAVVSPAMWSQQLPATLAASGVIAGLLFLWEVPGRAARPVLGGVALAAAVLARPETIVVVVAVAAWFAVRRGPRHAVGLVLVVAMAVSPWQLWVQRNFDTWLPTTGAAHVLAAGSDDEVLGGANIGSLSERPLPQPELEAASVSANLDDYRDQLPSALAPEVVSARVLRAWELWDAGNAREERAKRGLPFPGGAGGGYAQGAIACLGLIGAWRLRHRGRDLLPLYLAPVSATVGAAVTFGDRALVAYAAPAVLVFAGSAVVALVPNLPGPHSGRPEMGQTAREASRA